MARCLATAHFETAALQNESIGWEIMKSAHSHVKYTCLRETCSTGSDEVLMIISACEACHGLQVFCG